MTDVDSLQAGDVETRRIRVEFDTGSAFLSSELPHQIRNADMRVLASGRGNHTYRVPPGLYSVECVTAEGQRQSFVVDVVATETAEVRIDRRDPAVRRESREASTVAAADPVVPQAPKPPSAPAPPAPEPGKSAARTPEEGATVACATCGTVNPASRTFCTRCGSLLEPVERSRPRGWWPRLGRWGRPSRGVRRQAEPGVPSVPTPPLPLPPPSPPRSGSRDAASAGDAHGSDHGGIEAVEAAGAGSPTWEHDSVGAVLRSTDVRLVAMAGCAVQSAAGARLLFRPDGDVGEPAHVTFEIADRTAEMSLPIDPNASFPLGGAAVTATGDASGGIRLVAGFTDERRVATVIDAMSGIGSHADSDSLVRDASSLLLHKYADAPAAALGALMMQRLGRLDQREHWVSNLATDFPWLPDGKALHASLLRAGDDSQRRRGLQLLLEAAAQRPMFTDGLSLMISLLRRWPDDERAEERRAAIDRLGAYMVAADLDAVCLTVITGSPR